MKASVAAEAAVNYEAAARIGPVGDDLLIDWGLALRCAGRSREAAEKFRQAAQVNNTPHVHTQIATAYVDLRQFDLAFDELSQAEKIDPSYDMTYAYRGQIYELQNNHPAAAREYKRGCDLNPRNTTACQGVIRMSH